MEMILLIVAIYLVMEIIKPFICLGLLILPVSFLDKELLARSFLDKIPIRDKYFNKFLEKFRASRYQNCMSKCDACGEDILPGQKNVGHECDLHECCVDEEERQIDNEIKFCVSCELLNSYGFCDGSANGVVDIITGVPFSTAKEPKVMRYSEAYCGKMARWFEPKTVR